MTGQVKIKLKRFFLLEECPGELKPMDLYVIRDGNTVFYVGQSYLAFNRVWEHMRNGYKGRPDVGRFILCHWTKSLNFTTELFCS